MNIRLLFLFLTVFTLFLPEGVSAQIIEDDPKAGLVLEGVQATITPKRVKQFGDASSSKVFSRKSGSFVLDFEGLGNLDEVSEFYNGGTSEQGFSGPDFGISFNANALALIDADEGGTGNIANEPSPSTGFIFLGSGNPILNLPVGFETGFSFFYCAINSASVVEVYDGLDGTGNLIGSANLPITPRLGLGDPNGSFDNFQEISVPFSGVAKSIVFGGVANQVVFDDITFGNVVAGCDAFAGQILFDDESTEYEGCAGTGELSSIDVLELGQPVGENVGWVITDASDGTILGLPVAPPFDLSGAPAGTCNIYKIAYDDGLTGLMMQGNIANLDGCFGLSDPISVIRLEGEACAPGCPTVAFTAPADLSVDAGVQTGLSGGTPTGGVYSGDGVTDDGNGMNYSFDPATAGVGTHTLTYTYTFTDTNGCTNSATDDVEVTEAGCPTLIAIWNGAIDSDWTNTGNWQDNIAPGLSTDSAITIPTGMPYYPVLKFGQDLYISACSTVTIESGASLMVNPNVVVSNDGTITNNGAMTFGSNEKGSAYIGSGMGMFMGDFTVERYIPANRAFRQLASPVTTSAPILDNWQQDTHITGSVTGANGFDAQPTGNSSMYTFNNMAYNYVTMANTDNTNLLPNTLYHILVRGDRSIDITDNNTAATETTLRATGELTAENEGSSTLAISVPEQRFIAMGNPFQAPVDMNTVLTTNASNINPIYYWVWDPNLNTRGGYAQITALDGEPVPSDSNANQYLQAGQAGWVYTLDSGDTSISFTQASKATSVMETEVFKTSGKTDVSVGRINLSLFYENNASVNNLGSADGLSIRFDTEGNNGIDYYDAPKITNLDENFATNTEGNLFSTEYRAAPLNAEEIQLEINTYRHTNYTIVAEGVTRQGATAYLFDAYTNVSTEIPQNGTVNYAYTIDSGIPASIAGDRFKINFASIALSVDTYDMEEILLYPNPTSIGEFYLNIPIGMDDLEVTIYNALGAKLLNETGLSGGRKATIDTSLILSQGMYFVKLSSHGKTITKKLNIN